MTAVKLCHFTNCTETLKVIPNNIFTRYLICCTVYIDILAELSQGERRVSQLRGMNTVDKQGEKSGQACALFLISSLQIYCFIAG